MKQICRLAYAAELCRGKKVLDIGGGLMPGFKDKFAMAYSKILENSTEYRAVDIQDKPHINYVLDLSKEGSVEKLRAIIDDYKPEVILCMEILEHINYHYEVMNEMARSISKYHSAVFITISNNLNWIHNVLGWNFDHHIAFFRGHAERFIQRSDLGKFEVTLHYCTHKYLWYWWIVNIASFFQPLQFGFTIEYKGRESKRMGNTLVPGVPLSTQS